MQENTGTVLGLIGLSEGGYVNHPKDPGGPTDRGITQRTFDAYNKRHGLPKKAVKGISKELADTILAEQYLAPIRFNDLPAGLDYSVADFAVNSGPKRAVIELQRILGVTADGIMGEQTLAAIEGRDVAKLILAYNERRLQFLKSLTTWNTFGTGWKSRVMGKKMGAQGDDIGVIDRSWRMARGVDPAKLPQPKPAPGKASEADRKNTSILGEALKDPAILVPGAGAVLTPLAGGNGPVQWAIAAAILAGIAYVAVRALKRQL